MLNLLSLLWGRTASMLVLVVGAAVSLVGVRWRVRSNAKKELRHEQQRQVIEAYLRADKAGNAVGAMSDADVDDGLRKKGWIK